MLSSDDFSPLYLLRCSQNILIDNWGSGHDSVPIYLFQVWDLCCSNIEIDWIEKEEEVIAPDVQGMGQISAIFFNKINWSIMNWSNGLGIYN